MRHSYFYVDGVNPIGIDTIIWQTRLGSSKADQRRLLQLIALSVERGSFFERDSVEVSAFIHNLAASISGRCDTEGITSSIEPIEPSVLIRSLSLGVLPPRRFSATQHAQLMALSSSYRVRSLSGKPSSQAINVKKPKP